MKSCWQFRPGDSSPEAKIDMRTFVIAMLVFCLGASRAALAGDPPLTPPDLPDLDGIWLIESAPAWQKEINRSTLTISGDTFQFHGFRNLDKDWTGFITLAADGNPNHFELKTDEFSLAPYMQWVYPATADLPGILELKDNRLRISFANSDHGYRPDTFDQKPDSATTVATFVRADPNFTDFPDSVVVTVLDSGGKPAAGASLFSFESNMWPYKKNKDGRSVFDSTKPHLLTFDDRGTTGADGTIRLKYSEFCGQAVPIGAHLADHQWIGLANVSPATLCHRTLTIQMQPQRMLRGTLQREVKLGNNWGTAYLWAFGNRCAFTIAIGDAFELPVPPATYSVYFYGADVRAKTVQVTVPTGEGDFVMPPVALAATRLASLVGKPFPPIEKHAVA